MSQASTHPSPCSETIPLTSAQVGMLAFLCSEAAFFATLLIAYITYLGATTSGPMPRESLSLQLAIVNSVALLTSSMTIAMAVRARTRDVRGKGFTLWMILTVILGILFLVGTGYEWYQLINRDGLTISRNLFGTTFFTLIGFHGAHVTVGLATMCLLLVRHHRGRLAANSEAPELLSWYWHLVDSVWVVIVVVVYVLGR